MRLLYGSTPTNAGGWSTTTVIVCLPVWTPGSYLVREYSRHVQEFTVLDAAGAPVPFERLDKRSFRINAQHQPVRCQYKVYANELTVRTSHLDGTVWPNRVNAGRPEPPWN